MHHSLCHPSPFVPNCIALDDSKRLLLIRMASWPSISTQRVQYDAARVPIAPGMYPIVSGAVDNLSVVPNAVISIDLLSPTPVLRVYSGPCFHNSVLSVLGYVSTSISPFHICFSTKCSRYLVLSMTVPQSDSTNTAPSMASAVVPQYYINCMDCYLIP